MLSHTIHLLFKKISKKLKTPAATIPIATGALFAVKLQNQCFPMNNRAYKIEKPKKRSKEYSAKKAIKSIYHAVSVVHCTSSKTKQSYIN